MSLGGRPSQRQKRERVIAVATEHIEGAGIYYQPIRHDDWCPTLKTQSLGDCICDPEVPPPTKVKDIDEWIGLAEKADRGQPPS